MDKLVVVEKPGLPEQWNYEKSVSKVKTFIYKWKNLTIEILQELYIAREILAKEGRPKTVANATVFTWAQYCKDIGVNRSTVHRWLKRAFPKELPEYDESPPELEYQQWEIHHADMQTWQAPNEYDFIITDPPYKKEYLYLYEKLAERSKEWLKPGGLLVVMCGQSYLDEIFILMSKYLNYYWIGSYLTPGQPKPLRQKQVNTTWKPLLMFGDYTGKTFSDVFKSDANDKSWHEWGQSESGMLSIISMMCKPGQYILDPFCGAGTTGVAALKHGCLFDGVDIDDKNVKSSQWRLYLHDAKKE